MDSTYLIFRLQETHYGIDSVAAREIIPRLWLSPVEEQLEFVCGVVNLRGHLLPVIDLNLRFGRLAMPAALTDRIVVVETLAATFGILVQEVSDVCTLGPDDLFTVPLHQNKDSLIQALARRPGEEEQVLCLLALNRLLDAEFNLNLDLGSLPEVATEPEPLGEVFTAEERHTLIERAREFARPLASNASGEETTQRVAIIGLGGELLALGLDIVQEFLLPKAIVPVPGAPRHVVGVTSVRGEILPILTLRDAPANTPDAPQETAGVVILVVVNNVRFGVIADSVLDIVPRETQHTTLPYQNRIASYLEAHQLQALAFR
jgi:purine-binding chemotaxis protein CheW